LISILPIAAKKKGRSSAAPLSGVTFAWNEREHAAAEEITAVSEELLLTVQFRDQDGMDPDLCIACP
jgi:hypothetical protein